MTSYFIQIIQNFFVSNEVIFNFYCLLFDHASKIDFQQDEKTDNFLSSFSIQLPPKKTFINFDL
jgi:hypothetical protein